MYATLKISSFNVKRSSQQQQQQKEDIYFAEQFYYDKYNELR